MGLLDQDEIAAELGLSRRRGLRRLRLTSSTATSPRSRRSAPDSDRFVEELAELDVPEEPNGADLGWPDRRASCVGPGHAARGPRASLAEASLPTRGARRHAP